MNRVLVFKDGAYRRCMRGRHFRRGADSWALSTFLGMAQLDLKKSGPRRSAASHHERIADSILFGVMLLDPGEI